MSQVAEQYENKTIVEVAMDGNAQSYLTGLEHAARINENIAELYRMRFPQIGHAVPDALEYAAIQIRTYKVDAERDLKSVRR